MSTVERAGDLVRGMVEMESKGWGDQFAAVRRIGHRYGILLNALEHLRTGRAKTVNGDLLSRIRAAYLDVCERQIAKLQKQLEIERALGVDDDLEDIGIEAARLAALIAEKKARR